MDHLKRVMAREKRLVEIAEELQRITARVDVLAKASHTETDFNKIMAYQREGERIHARAIVLKEIINTLNREIEEDRTRITGQ